MTVKRNDVKNRMNQELIKSLFHYDPETGVFRRIGRLKCNGDVAECDFTPTAKSTHGYIQVRLMDVTFDIHTLIWLYMTGEYPQNDIDHLDGNRLNNKWSNLRSVTRKSNLRNVGKRHDPQFGMVGIGRLTNNPEIYRVYIGSKHLGTTRDLFEAYCIRKSAELEHGYSQNHFKRSIWGK